MVAIMSLSFILTVMALMVHRSIQETSETENIPESMTFDCKNRARDVIVVIDSSDSTTSTTYQSTKATLNDALSWFAISPNKTRIGLIDFGDSAKVQYDLTKNPYSSNINFANRLLKYKGGQTVLGLALTLAYTELIPTMYETREKIMLVVSSGPNEKEPDTFKISTMIKAKNVTILSIGIGDKTNIKELRNISSSDSVMVFQNVQEFALRQAKMTGMICESIDIVPTTTSKIVAEKVRTSEKQQFTPLKPIEIVTEHPQSEKITELKVRTSERQQFTPFKPIEIVTEHPQLEKITELKVGTSVKQTFTPYKPTEQQHSATSTESQKNIPDSMTPDCRNRARDVIVVIDSSASTTKNAFENTKATLNDALSWFAISPNKTRIGLIDFGDSAKVQYDLTKHPYNSNLSFANRILKYKGGQTVLGLALSLAYTKLLPTMYESRERILLVFSSGPNEKEPETYEISTMIKAKNVTILSIGIGDKIDINELRNISSSDSVIVFQDVREFALRKAKMTGMICDSIDMVHTTMSVMASEKVRTSERSQFTPFKPIEIITKHPTSEKMTKLHIGTSVQQKLTPFKPIGPITGQQHSASSTKSQNSNKSCNETQLDLMFAFDSSSSLSEDHWNQELQLGIKVIEDLKIGLQYSQVGMLSFSSKSVININLGSIQNKEGIKKEMMKQELMEGATYMAEALNTCKDELFEKGRLNVKKTIILVTDGAANSPTLQVETESEKIKKLGIKIIVVGLGFSVLKNQLINISSSEMYYPIEDMNKISLFDTSELAKEACHIPKPIRVCDSQIDIILLIDISSQISNSEHLSQIQFSKQFISLFDLGENKTRISLVAFSDEADLRLAFTTNYNDSFSVLQQLTIKGGLTQIDKALILAKKIFYLRADGLNSRKLVVLLTNGLSKEPTKSIGESYDLQEDGIELISVGVNPNADREELKLLSSSDMYLHRGDVKMDETLVQDAVKIACTQSPKIIKNVCESIGDVVFVIDKSITSKEDVWEGMKTTLIVTMRSLNISRDLTRVSIIGYSDQVKIEFRLDENFSSRDIYVALKQLKQSGVGGELSSALRQARQMLKFNSRYNVAKALVILADKLPSKQKEVLELSEDLKSDGIKVITVGLSKDSPTNFFEELSSKKSHIQFHDINKVLKHKEELRLHLCDALTNKLDQCTSKVLDVIVTMDSSSSVGPDNWQIQLNFINRLIGNLDLKKGRTRLGVFTFGTYVDLRIPINSSLTADEIQKEVQKIPFVEGMTAIGLAIQEGTFHLLQRGRVNTPQVLVLLTDGSNTRGISPQITAVEAKKSGIKIITVGIGGEISTKELKDISSSGDFYSVNDFQDLEKYNAKTITNDACQIPEKTKICDGAGDLVFIMGSGADKGTDRFEKISDFMKTLTNLTIIGRESTRVAILKFNRGAYIDSGFKDNYPEFAKSIETMTSSVDGVFIGKALERSRILFDSDKRKNATKSVVIISDSKISDRNKTFVEAELLRKAGIKIFVIGVTENISREDLGQVASKGRALFVNDFHNLNNYNAFISSELCEVIKGTNKECSNKQLEVMIAMDSSSSIGPDHWQTQLSFVEKIIKEMDISQSMTRVGLITFNTIAKKQFGLFEYSDKHAMISALKRIEFSEGLTAIGDALRDCKLELMNNSRRGTPQLIILITDGVSKGGVPPEDESILIKKYGIKIITIGIGDSISQSQLKFLSSTNNVYNVLDYTSLKEYDSTFITQESCLAGKSV